MHKSTKITPVLRKEIFKRWKGDSVSQRQLAREYHVDKRVIGKIIERGKQDDFSVHSSINKRYLKTTKAKVRKPTTSHTKTNGEAKKKSSAKKSIAKKSPRDRSKK